MSSDDRELPEESAEDLYETAPCGYLSTTPDGVIAKINATLLSWLGYQRDEVLHKKRFIDLLSLPSRVFHETHYAPLLHVQGFAKEVAADLVSREGRVIPVLLNSVQKVREDGSVYFTRTTVFNAENRRKYERELLLERRKAEVAAKARADFLVTASHEIRNHLHSIAAVSRLFALGKAAPQQDKFVKLLDSSSNALLNLVTDILDYARLDAGKVALDERTFDVRELLAGVAFGLRARADVKGLTVRVDVDDQVPQRLLGDPIKIAQVLTNLGGNAVKYTEHGVVILSVRQRQLGPAMASISFSVSDTGMGIAEERLSALCESDGTAIREPRPSHEAGLGLAISRHLLALCGGKLRAASVLGKGTVFSFDLSLRVPELPLTCNMRSEASEARALRGIRVLVAEDAEVDALVLRRLLERWGVEVELVDSGLKAVQRVKEHAFDLVLMELELPELDGMSAVRAIRALNDGHDSLPIIALAPAVEVGQRDRLHGAGFTDCLGKPFESDMLYRSVSMHASIHRSLSGWPAERVDAS